MWSEEWLEMTVMVEIMVSMIHSFRLKGRTQLPDLINFCKKMDL